MGFTDIKIYNGGIKDWRKSGFKLVRQAQLPEIETTFIDTESFFALLKKAEIRSCKDGKNKPLLTVADFRNGNHLENENKPQQISTVCPTVHMLIDDLLTEKNHDRIPRNSTVITITETGNRDEFIIRYLSQHGYRNIEALRFGMRGWIKLHYPTN